MTRGRAMGINRTDHVLAFIENVVCPLFCEEDLVRIVPGKKEWLAVCVHILHQVDNSQKHCDQSQS